MSAAVAASLLGVYGTVAGAAVMSVLASVGGAIYTHSFRKGQLALERARQQRTGRLRKVQGDQAVGRDDAKNATEDDAKDRGEGRAEDESTRGEATRGETVAASTATTPEKNRISWRERLAGINPKAVAATAACVLVLSLGGILLAETVIGKPISSALGKGDDHGGNSLTRLTGG